MLAAVGLGPFGLLLDELVATVQFILDAGLKPLLLLRQSFQGALLPLFWGYVVVALAGQAQQNTHPCHHMSIQQLTTPRPLQPLCQPFYFPSAVLSSLYLIQ